MAKPKAVRLIPVKANDIKETLPVKASDCPGEGAKLAPGMRALNGDRPPTCILKDGGWMSMVCEHYRGEVKDGKWHVLCASGMDEIIFESGQFRKVKDIADAMMKEREK